jgi:hypothetical protein
LVTKLHENEERNIEKTKRHRETQRGRLGEREKGTDQHKDIEEKQINIEICGKRQINIEIVRNLYST